LRGLLREARAARLSGRQLIIFPEGTRVAPGKRVPLQSGVAAISAHLDLPVVPVATDSGLSWGRRAFMKRAGIVHVNVGPPLPHHLSRSQLLHGIEDHWRTAERHGFAPVDNLVEKPLARRAGTNP
jgi:1-acyl-sn-glycerol-3-phosphate acyltransferase